MSEILLSVYSHAFTWYISYFEKPYNGGRSCTDLLMNKWGRESKRDVQIDIVLKNGYCMGTTFATFWGSCFRNLIFPPLLENPEHLINRRGTYYRAGGGSKIKKNSNIEGWPLLLGTSEYAWIKKQRKPAPLDCYTLNKTWYPRPVREAYLGACQTSSWRFIAKVVNG